jgi:uncharacterized DUF497 family protein
LPKRLILTSHAEYRLRQRGLNLDWVAKTVLQPDWVEPQPRDDGVERRFRAIEERGGRVVRVACVETETTIRVISAMFDRAARRRS